MDMDIAKTPLLATFVALTNFATEMPTLTVEDLRDRLDMYAAIPAFRCIHAERTMVEADQATLRHFIQEALVVIAEFEAAKLGRAQGNEGLLRSIGLFQAVGTIAHERATAHLSTLVENAWESVRALVAALEEVDMHVYIERPILWVQEGKKAA